MLSHEGTEDLSLWKAAEFSLKSCQLYTRSLQRACQHRGTPTIAWAASPWTFRTGRRRHVVQPLRGCATSGGNCSFAVLYFPTDHLSQDMKLMKLMKLCRFSKFRRWTTNVGPPRLDHQRWTTNVGPPAEPAPPAWNATVRRCAVTTRRRPWRLRHCSLRNLEAQLRAPMGNAMMWCNWWWIMVKIPGFELMVVKIMVNHGENQCKMVKTSSWVNIICENTPIVKTNSGKSNGENLATMKTVSMNEVVKFNSWLIIGGWPFDRLHQ